MGGTPIHPLRSACVQRMLCHFFEPWNPATYPSLLISRKRARSGNLWINKSSTIFKRQMWRSKYPLLASLPLLRVPSMHYHGSLLPQQAINQQQIGALPSALCAITILVFQNWRTSPKKSKIPWLQHPCCFWVCESLSLYIHIVIQPSPVPSAANLRGIVDTSTSIKHACYPWHVLRGTHLINEDTFKPDCSPEYCYPDLSNVSSVTQRIVNSINENLWIAPATFTLLVHPGESMPYIPLHDPINILNRTVFKKSGHPIVDDWNLQSAHQTIDGYQITC